MDKLDPSIESKDVILRLNGVTRAFESVRGQLPILTGINLTLALGESAALSGPSGSGKSTLIHLIAGTDKPTQGEITWRGQSLLALSEAKRSAWRLNTVGLVFQDFRLFPHLTALENVALPLELLGKTAHHAEESAREILGEVGLEERLAHYPHQLSGGEQQRVAISRALVHQPQLLLADEPTGNLDRKSALHIADLLLSLPAQKGVALFIVTHDLTLAKRADKHWIMSEGVLDSIIEQSS